MICQPENVPVLVSCAAGKERTGLIAMLVMSVIGRTREEIVAEFVQSKVRFFKLTVHMSCHTIIKRPSELILKGIMNQS